MLDTVAKHYREKDKPNIRVSNIEDVLLTSTNNARETEKENKSILEESNEESPRR